MYFINLIFNFQSLVTRCDKDYKGSPCINGGKCSQNIADFKCECKSGFTGRICDVPNISCQAMAEKKGKTIISETTMKNNIVISIDYI